MPQIVHFTSDFDYTPSNDPYMTIAYRAGFTVEVDDECAEKAVLLGRAQFADYAEDDLFQIPDDSSLDLSDEED